MEHLHWGYIQLGLVALVFGGLQVWWIGSVFLRRDVARPQSGGVFRKSLERIWKKEQRQGKSGNGCVSIWSRGRKNSGTQGGISPQLLLTVLNVRQQIPQEHPHPWRLLGVPGSIDSKHRETSADLLQGQQGTLNNLSGKGRDGEQWHRIWNDCSQCSHRHPATFAPLPNQWCRPVLATIA